jgi:hypothetical protein
MPLASVCHVSNTYPYKGASPIIFPKPLAGNTTHISLTAVRKGTNCVAFQIECKIPTPKRKKPNASGRDSDRYEDGRLPPFTSRS